MPEKIKIFLSYASKDEARVKELYIKLGEEGYEPWMDKKNILPGENVELAIKNAIRDCDFFLICLSANAVGERGILQMEIKMALDNWRKKLNSDIYLIPARLENCEVPDSLSDLQPVNLFDEDGWILLIRAVQVGMERRSIETQRQTSNALERSKPTTILEMSIDVPDGKFDETKKELFQFALAGLLQISPDAVRIRLTKKGSIKVIIELPRESANRLLIAYKNNDPELSKHIAPIVIREVRVVAEIKEQRRQQQVQDRAPKALKIFVAWPLDVKDERDRAEEVIKTLNQEFLSRACYLEMLDWRKSVPPGAGNPEDIILETTDPQSWDVFIGILWRRFGTPLKEINRRTGKPYASGFEAEYQRAHDLWQENERPHIMLYRCTRPIPHDTDVDQLKLVQHFFQGVEKRYEVLYKEFGSLDDFANELAAHLRAVIEKLIAPKPQTKPVVFPHSRLFEDIAEETDFSNRVHELADIQYLLATDLEASIMVYAPAGMGKSRLIKRLQEVMRLPSWGNATLSFYYIELDCHVDEKISSSVEELLLTIHQKLPQPKVTSANRPALIQAIRVQAVDLTSQNQRLIILLDRIELMSSECRAFIRRELLPELRKAVRDPAYYPAVIAFGRVHPREWRGKDTVRFKTVNLSAFNKAVIKEILLRKTEELNKKEKRKVSFQVDAYDEWSEIILNISHGHPRCIVNLVSWLYEQHFAMPSNFYSKETFMSFVMPVIEREILSEDNLVPLEPIEERGVRAKLLRQLLPYICVFRFYSRAQLRILTHCNLIKDDEIEALEQQLGRTFLIDRPLSHVSYTPHKVIRKLLADALYYQAPEIFAKIHQTTYEFYDMWIRSKRKIRLSHLRGDVLQDYAQIEYIVECLYHYTQACRVLQLEASLEELLRRYLNSIRSSDMHTKQSLIEKLDELLLEDDELEQSLRLQGKSDEYKALLSLVEQGKD